MKAYSLSGEQGMALLGKLRRILRLLATPSTSASDSGEGLRPEVDIVI